MTLALCEHDEAADLTAYVSLHEQCLSPHTCQEITDYWVNPPHHWLRASLLTPDWIVVRF